METNLNIYAFRNMMSNYTSGYFYFVSPDLPFAIDLANKFQDKHNEKVNSNKAYTIKFDFSDYKVNAVKVGYLNIR